MKRFVVLLVVALALCVLATAAQATDWTTYLTSTGTTGTIKVVSSVTQVGSLWHYSYDVTPVSPADYVRGYTIVLGSKVIALVSNVATTASGWSGYADATKVYWTWEGTDAERLNTGETFTFSFDHPWSPVAFYNASCQDDFGFSGVVAGPVVPEASTMLLGFAGLSCIAGLRKLRIKK
ncbi:hypothetical protein LLG46_14350 [bacterium]|nr:hypothetical protein [bacterium]